MTSLRGLASLTYVVFKRSAYNMLENIFYTKYAFRVRVIRFVHAR